MERKEFDGEWFISHELLAVGDYGGSGAVGEANIRSLEGVDGAHTEHGSYHSRQLWLPDTEANRDILQDFDRYPVLDDEALSDVEADWEVEAWDSWLRSDLLRTLPDGWHDLVEDCYCTGGATEEGDSYLGNLFEAYREAMERTNTYPAAEYSGVHVNVERIKDKFQEIVRESCLAVISEQAVALGIAPDSPLFVVADRMEEAGHPLAESVRYLSSEVGV